MTTVLIIEDEPELVKVLRSYLENAGYTVLTTSRGDTGLALFKEKSPDLVLLDLNLPGMDGIDVTREIRHRGNVPLLILTARVEETDRLVGLELGADDYIPKPYSPREVVARVRAVLRRAGSTSAAAGVIRYGGLEVDVDSHTTRLEERELDLTPMEFSLLAAMAAQPGRAFSRLQLLEAAQGVAYEGYERTIDSHIKNLRAKLGDTPPRIETVFGIGYRYRKETPR